MNTKYTIKNFRVFNEEGVTVDIKPITILTGCNSSGKSSIVKSMVLLNTYIEELQEDYKAYERIDLKKHKLDFTQDTTFSLGNFSRIRHKGSEDKTITFQYLVHSLLLGEDVKVSMVFVSDDNDALNEGYLKGITILNMDDEIIYTSSNEEPCSANYNLIINNFFRFAYGQLLVFMQNEYTYRHYNLYGCQTEEEFHESLHGMPTDCVLSQESKEKKLKEDKVAIDSFLSKFASLYKEDSLKDIRTWEEKNGKDHCAFSNDDKKLPLISHWLDGNYGIMDKSLNLGTLFYFPLLEKMYNVDYISFKDTLIKTLEGVTLEKEVIYAIDKISDDFKSSGKEFFFDYFKMKEASFMTIKKGIKSLAPYIGGTNLLKTDSIFGDKVYDESFLQWTRRMQGPAFEEFEGNTVQMIGEQEYSDWKKCPVDFNVLYDVMMNINNLMDDSKNIFYEAKSDYTRERYSTYHHYLFDMFAKYASMVMEEVVTSAIPKNLSYIGTSLVSVKREYSLDSNDNFSNLIKRYFVALRNYKNSRENNLLGKENFMSRWVRKLGVGHSISIEVSNSGSSFVVRLFKAEEDKEGTILAEEGYGITQIVTLLIRIETAILESEKSVDVDDYEMPICTFSESTIAVEEPEVHLHPKFQSLLAEMFVEAYKKYNVHFIVETHSEYLIRKLQLMVASDDYGLKGNEVSIGYIDKDERGKSINRSIEILEDGSLSESFGHGFYDEADTLAIELFKKKPILS